MPQGIPNPTEYVHVEDDGMARELEPDEIEYLGKAFHGADGGRPYIKSTYHQLTPDNRIHGYLLRTKLPAGTRIKSSAEAVPVETAEDAIRVAKLGLPIMNVVKSGTPMGRVIGKSGRLEFGLPGVDVSSGTFSATLAGGVWRVIRLPAPSSADTEQACYIDVSAASGRVIQYGWPNVPYEPQDTLGAVPGAGSTDKKSRPPWWRFWSG